jgi:hypothetical protein
MVSRVESPNQVAFKRYGSTEFDLCAGHTVVKQSDLYSPAVPVVVVVRPRVAVQPVRRRRRGPAVSAVRRVDVAPEL